MLYFALALSVFSVGVVIRALALLSAQEAGPDRHQRLPGQTSACGDVKGARKELGASRTVEAEVIADALAYYDEGPDSVQEMVQKGIRQRRKVFESGLLFLGTLGNNSPFVGLFGTVLG